MPQNKPAANATSLSSLYKKRFKEALTKDINSGMHGMETNQIALSVAILMIDRLKSDSAFSLEQLIRGALNYAVLCEHRNYNIITEKRVNPNDAQQFDKITKQWFKNIPTKSTVNAIKDNEEKYIAVGQAFIKNAAKSPLFIVPGCVFNTLTVYFKYAKKLDANVVVPALPPYPINAHPLQNPDTSFKLLISDLSPLDTLKRQVSGATELYVDYNKSVWYSLFHRHGATGRARAQKFDGLFQKIDNLSDAKKALADYLNDDTK